MSWIASGKPMTSSEPAGEDTRLAVIGAGLIGQRHVELVARYATLDAIVDPNPAAQTLAEAHGAHWADDINAYLDERRPDGAIVATPNQLHASHGLACIDAGVPVLIEKPITDSADAGEALVAASAKASVPILVGHHRRHNPLVTAAKEAIESGRLGEVVSVHAQCWLLKPDDYFAPEWRRTKGAGPVYINLIHDIDLIRHLCGEIATVQAFETSKTRGFAVEDTAAILLEFVNGALGTVSVSDTIVAPWSWELTAGENPAYPETGAHCYMIGGTKGALSIPDLKLWSHPGARGWWEPIEAARLNYSAEDPLVRQLRNFIDVVRNGAAPLVSGREGLATLRVIEAIKRAAAAGQPQTPGGRAERDPG